ncbi:hypothetical protein [Acetobacter orientalis]|uniref:hypothetical protein n=1 Tax=Acetobacter orientalis TaxID=146474 RepID=UPI0039E9C364
MQKFGPVVIDNKIIKYGGNNYPSNRIDFISIDNNQKIKSALIAAILWVIGIFYGIDFYQKQSDFSFEETILCLVFALVACFFALSKKTFVKMSVAKKSIVIKAPDKVTAVQICDAVTREISASSN